MWWWFVSVVVPFTDYQSFMLYLFCLHPFFVCNCPSSLKMIKILSSSSSPWTPQVSRKPHPSLFPAAARCYLILWWNVVMSVKFCHGSMITMWRITASLLYDTAVKNDKGTWCSCMVTAVSPGSCYLSRNNSPVWPNPAFTIPSPSPPLLPSL